jgi:hypothetical protein
MNKKPEENLAGISGLHGTDAKEIFNIVQYMEKYKMLLAFIRYDVTHSPGYDEIQRLCKIVSRSRETL